MIKENVEVDCWNFVSGSDNSADLATRITTSLADIYGEKWFHGPSLLQLRESEWSTLGAIHKVRTFKSAKYLTPPPPLPYTRFNKRVTYTKTINVNFWLNPLFPLDKTVESRRNIVFSDDGCDINILLNSVSLEEGIGKVNHNREIQLFEKIVEGNGVCLAVCQKLATLFR